MNEDTSEQMVKKLKALANPLRLKMIASLCEKPKSVYTLAKELDLPYPLAHLHLNGLKKLGLVKEVREEKKKEGLPPVKYYAPTDFKIILTPKEIKELFKKEKGGEMNG
ncbi:MAG: winged helix-turn-helix domain-containing protein [Candidatus Bathyarchaeia archaeon]